LGGERHVGSVVDRKGAGEHCIEYKKIIIEEEVGRNLYCLLAYIKKVDDVT